MPAGASVTIFWPPMTRMACAAPDTSGPSWLPEARRDRGVPEPGRSGLASHEFSAWIDERDAFGISAAHHDRTRRDPRSNPSPAPAARFITGEQLQRVPGIAWSVGCGTG